MKYESMLSEYASLLSLVWFGLQQRLWVISQNRLRGRSFRLWFKIWSKSKKSISKKAVLFFVFDFVFLFCFFFFLSLFSEQTVARELLLLLSVAAVAKAAKQTVFLPPSFRAQTAANQSLSYNFGCVNTIFVRERKKRNKWEREICLLFWSDEIWIDDVGILF